MLWIRYSMRYYGVGRVYWSGHGDPPLSISFSFRPLLLPLSLSLCFPLSLRYIFSPLLLFHPLVTLSFPRASLSSLLFFFPPFQQFFEPTRSGVGMNGKKHGSRFFRVFFFFFFFFWREKDWIFPKIRVKGETHWQNWRTIVHLLMREHTSAIVLERRTTEGVLEEGWR